MDSVEDKQEELDEETLAGAGHLGSPRSELTFGTLWDLRMQTVSITRPSENIPLGLGQCPRRRMAAVKGVLQLPAQCARRRFDNRAHDRFSVILTVR